MYLLLDYARLKTFESFSSYFSCRATNKLQVIQPRKMCHCHFTMRIRLYFDVFAIKEITEQYIGSRCVVILVHRVRLHMSYSYNLLAGIIG